MNRVLTSILVCVMLLVSAVGIATVAPDTAEDVPVVSGFVAEDVDAHLTAFGHWHYSPANGGNLADWEKYCEPFVISAYAGSQNANCYWPAYTASTTFSAYNEQWWRVSIRAKGYADPSRETFTSFIWQDAPNGRAGSTPTLPCLEGRQYPAGTLISPCS